MPELSISEVQAALAVIKRDEPIRRVNRKTSMDSAASGLRRDIGSRRDGIDSGVTPLAPTVVVLDKPFLIWAVRDGGQPTSLLVDSHLEAQNSWAKIYFSQLFESVFLHSEEVGFYFLWQNDSAKDSVVNASTYLSLNGRITVNPRAGWIPTIWWGTGTIGQIDGIVSAELTPLEWWNQPPTHPPMQADQYRVIREISATGDWTPLASPGAGTADKISESYHLYHSMFRIPPGGSAVFEVRVQTSVGGRNSSIDIDFANDGWSIVCPYVELEVLTTAQLDVSPEIRP
jgi:hypothetical protein